MSGEDGVLAQVGKTQELTWVLKVVSALSLWGYDGGTFYDLLKNNFFMGFESWKVEREQIVN
jgi:hypothetical protein